MQNKETQEVMTLWLIALKIGLNARHIHENRNIWNFHNSFALAWWNSGSHNFSVNTDYWLIYMERTLYNIPIGEKYFDFEMNMCTLISNYKYWTWCEYAMMLLTQTSVSPIQWKGILYNMINSVCKNLILISSINSMHKNKVSLLMVQIFFISILHLNLLKFKYLTIINFTYH